jgi:ankyrin repeat protein
MNGMSALHYAAEGGHFHIVECLITNGADIYLKGEVFIIYYI